MKDNPWRPKNTKPSPTFRKGKGGSAADIQVAHFAYLIGIYHNITALQVYLHTTLWHKVCMYAEACVNCSTSNSISQKNTLLQTIVHLF